MSNDLFLPVAELIPHHGDSILLSRVTHHDADATRASVVVSDQRWLKRPDGSVASWLAVEYMAQCIGAHEGLVAHEECRQIDVGFLVRVSELRLTVPRFERDDVLEVRTRRVRGRPGIGALAHQCSIHRMDDREELLAEGRLMLAIPRPPATHR
jgi:predicted hotdog family 3-hydroxylacyl-ACP dehydratase